jgi:hypothetical protein
MHTIFGLEREHLQDLVVDGTTIMKMNLGRGEVAQDRYKWRFFNAKIKLIHKATKTDNFIIFSVITNIYNKKTKGHNVMELFTATG